MNVAIDFRIRLRTPDMLKGWFPTPAPPFAPYVRLYKMEDRLTPQSIEETIKEMNNAGISQAVLCSGNELQNEIVYEICKQYPDVFYGIAGARPDEGVMKAYHTLKKAFSKFELKGFNFGGWLMSPHGFR